MTRKIYELLQENRKEVALRIKSHKYFDLGFYALDHMEMTPQGILNGLDVQKIIKLIPDYKFDSLVYLFAGIRDDTFME